MPEKSPEIARPCARCGASLPEGASECPRCLLRFGLRASAEPEPGAEGAETSAPAHPRAEPPGSGDAGPGAEDRRRHPEPPTLDEVRAAFPDLDVQELLGRGGMGSVFKARQRKLERTVALKVLPRALGEDPDFAERFLREARALARLSHPGIVTVHDFGNAGGFFFLVMEYVDGLDLRRLMRQGLMQPRQALAIARDLCDALQFAHDEGIIHRDIKPENVLLDSRGRVKIADFGLAKLADAAGAEPQGALTRSDQVMGTPHYMAPEQLERPLEVDHRADIFALGVVLYEMLTGSLPRGNFEPPSRRVEIDVRLDEIVLKALEREPERRYQQALEVKTDVEHVEAGPPQSRRRAGSSPVFASPAIAPAAGGSPAGAPAAAARAAPPPLRKDPFRGPRALAVLALLWIALAALWNVGAFAFGLGIPVLGITLAALANGRLRRDPELSAALDALPLKEQAWRTALAVAALGLGLLAIAAGHVSHWERGASGWAPAWRGTMGAFDAWKSDPFALARLSGEPQVGAEPALALSKSYTIDGSEIWSALPPWPLILAGVLLLGLAIASGTHVRAPDELRRRSWHLGAELASYALGALLLLWVAAPIAALRPDVVLHGTERRFETVLGVDQARGALRAAFLEVGLQVDVDQRLSIFDLRTGEEILPGAILRAQSSSPFERWSTSFRGPLRETPQVWVTLVARSGEPGTAVLMRAGLCDPASDEGRRAEELLASLQRALVSG